MKNISIGAASLLVALYISYLFLRDDDLNVIQPSPSSTPLLIETKIVPVISKKQPLLLPSENVAASITEPNCISESDVIRNEKFELLFVWVQENIGANVIDSYNYLSEDELLLAARFDSRAMLILGINYRWHSSHESFTSPEVLEGSNVKQATTKPYELATINKAIHYLMLAKVNGELSASDELYRALMEKRDHLLSINKKGLYNSEIEILELNALANQMFLSRIYPDAFPIDNSSIEHLSKEQLSQLNEVITNEDAKYAEKRLTLGYPFKNQLSIPNEVKEIMNEISDLCIQ